MNREAVVVARPRIETGAFGPAATNAYLVWDGRSADALVVDPGKGAADPLLARVAANELRLQRIANSHGHWDHIFDNAPLKRASAAPLAIHGLDAYRLAGDPAGGPRVEPSTAEWQFAEGDQLRVGELVFDVLHTPGHTEGSVCLYEARHGLLLSGDTLFAGGWGRTDLPGGSDEQMVASLARLCRDLPPPVRVLPGHGPETTIATERGWMNRVAASGRLALSFIS